MSLKANYGELVMDKKVVAKFKKMLLTERERLLNNAASSKKNDLAVSSDDLADEADLASAELTQGVVFNLRQKEKQMLADIDEALAKLESGEYGTCEECGDEIPARRLELFPTARLCIQHQEEKERRSKNFVA